jgi:rod shape-determining protein MreD
VSKLIGNTSHTKKWWVIPGTLVIAFCFWVLPGGLQGQNYAPDWISLILIYWCFAIPRKIGLGSAWLTGLLLDVVSFGVLGRYALSKVVIVFLAERLAFRVRVFPVWQQSFVISVLLAVETALLILLGLTLGEPELFSYSRWIAVVVGALLWFPVYFVLRRVRHWARLP